VDNTVNYLYILTNQSVLITDKTTAACRWF